MFGIAFRIRRDSTEGVTEKVVYLRSRRRGPEGEKMRAAIKAYHRASFDQARLAAKVGAMMNRGLSGETAGMSLEDIEAKQTSALAEAQNCSSVALEQAEIVATLALDENYGAEEAAKMVGDLTDHELHGIIGAIELGSMPKDFFPSPDIQPKLSTTGSSGT